MGDERARVTDAENASVERVLGKDSVDFFDSRFEVGQGTASFVEVIGIDCGNRLALLDKCFGASAPQLKFSRIENARRDQLGVKAHQLELDVVIWLRAFEHQGADCRAFLQIPPGSGIGYSETGLEFGLYWSLGLNCRI